MQLSLKRWVVFILLSGSLAACSSTGGFFSSKDKAYRSQKRVDSDLAVPPDLLATEFKDAMAIPGDSGTSYSEYQNRQEGDKGRIAGAAGETVLPAFEGIEVMRDRDLRWLVIKAPAEDVWFKVVEFWRQNGLLLVEQDPSIGVMSTDWLESRSDVKQGYITEFFRKFFDSVYSSATRDRFRVRLEPGDEPGTTELFLTHRGLEEKLVENIGGGSDTTYWTPRPNEPETEAAMLRALMIYLGSEEKQADQKIAEAQAKPERAHLLKDGQSIELRVDERFPRAWRLVGVALDREGFTVEDRDRENGLYFVRYSSLIDKKKEGFFSFLAFWRDKEVEDTNLYQVKLEGVDDKTRVWVNNDKGERQNNETANRLLTLLYEQVR